MNDKTSNETLSSPETKEQPWNLLSKSPTETEKFADLYPERRAARIEYSKWEIAKGRESAATLRERCGINVTKALEWPLIKLMLSSLKAQGCITDVFERHVSCDICKDSNEFPMQGGFDDQNNQGFICSNNIGSSMGQVHGTLLRNLIHMYDVCTRKVNFKDVNHLACMEIRKANIAGCNLGIHMSRLNPFYIKDQHRECVFKTATYTLSEKIDDKDLAEKAVTNVFRKCYNDTEPIGRNCKNKEDMNRAYEERFLFAND